MSRRHDAGKAGNRYPRGPPAVARADAERTPAAEGVRQKTVFQRGGTFAATGPQRLAVLPQPLELATEHILLGLAAADHEVSVWLRQRGLDPDALEAEIRKLYGYQRGRGEGRGDGGEGESLAAGTSAGIAREPTADGCQTNRHAPRPWTPRPTVPAKDCEWSRITSASCWTTGI